MFTNFSKVLSIALLLVFPILPSRILDSDTQRPKSHEGICSSYIGIVSGFSCVRDYHIAKGEESSVFLVTDKDQKTFIMKVQTKGRRSRLESQMFDKLEGKSYVAQRVAEGTLSDLHVIVMEYGERSTLEVVLQSTDHFSQVFNMFAFFTKLIEGIKAIHETGYVHAGISLRTVVVTQDYEPMIINFTRMTAIGTKDEPKGFEQFQSPEIIHAISLKNEVEYTKSVDIFAAGVILYYMHLNVFPFENYGAHYHSFINTQIKFPEGSSSCFQNVIHRLLQFEDKVLPEDDILNFLNTQVNKKYEFPITNNYCYTLKSNTLTTYVNYSELKETSSFFLFIIGGVVLVLLVSFCFCQICLYFVWSKTSQNVVSARPSEMNIDTTFIDSVNVSRIPGLQKSKRDAKPDTNNI